MSLFLLQNSIAEKPAIDFRISFSERAEERTVREANYELKYSWIPGNNFEPFYKTTSGTTLFANGLLYLNGIRIDTQWPVIYERWKRSGVEGLKELDGYGNLLIWDHAAGSWTIITSRLGFLPLYAGSDPGSNRAILGTHTDQIARLLNSTELDMVSMADFIRTGSVCAPYTYYRNISQLEPASIYCLNKSGLSQVKKYWKPDLDHKNFLPAGEAARLVAESIGESVNKRISENGGKALLLLSGGLDSRAALFAADNASGQLKTATFYNTENIELQIAAKLSRKGGAEHFPLQRSFDYYGDLAVEGIRSTGGMWPFSNLHTTGFDRQLNELNEGVLLSALNFDNFFKGFAYKKKIRHNRLTGRMFSTLSSQDVMHDAKGAEDLNAELNREVIRRRTGYCGYREISETELTPQLLNRVKYNRVKYMFRKRSGGMVIDLYNKHYYDSISSDTRFTEIFSYLNPYDEIKVGFMKRVLENIDETALSVPDANERTSHLVNNNYYLTAARHVARKYKRKIWKKPPEANEIGMDSSWIDWEVYRQQSSLMKKLWEECSHHERTRLTIEQVMGYNPYARSPSAPSTYYAFVNLLTIGLWLKYGYAGD